MKNNQQSKAKHKEKPEKGIESRIIWIKYFIEGKLHWIKYNQLLTNRQGGINYIRMEPSQRGSTEACKNLQINKRGY